ncbi:hypothetical protein ACLB2K_016590 [Fragaria x ananassa]
MNEEMFFAIAGHNFTVVAQDGAYIKPILTSYIMITPGQTMDILLTANQPPSYYYMAASPYFESGAPHDETTTTAILQYTNVIAAPTNISMPTLPIETDNISADNFTSKIKALASKDHPISVPKNVTKQILITVSVNQLPCELGAGLCGGPNGNRLSASLNNISFDTPTTDILQAYYSFYVVGSAYGDWNQTTSPATYNLIDPPAVNTVGVPRNGWTAIRFVADNPERHASWGMDAVLIVKNGSKKNTSILRPPRNLPICA